MKLVSLRFYHPLQSSTPIRLDIDIISLLACVPFILEPPKYHRFNAMFFKSHFLPLRF